MASAKQDSMLKGLECSICNETFTTPKILVCFHSFCEDCLREWNHSHAPMVSCPLCRVETRFPEKGVEGLQTNFHLVGLIEEFSLYDKLARSTDTKFRCGICDNEEEATRHPDSDMDLGKLVLEGKWELGLEFGEHETKEVQYYDVCFLEPNKIAVAEIRGKQVITFNTKGEKEGVIQMEEYPRRVASMNDQLIVTDSTDHVKVYNKDNTQAFQFPTTIKDSDTSVSLRGVVMKQNVITVGDVKKNVLTEHHPDGSLIRTIPVKVQPQFLAIDSNGRVVICSRGANERVDVVDGNGATLFTIKPTINDQQIKYCRGVCCDGTDIYIAMTADTVTTGHIHRYDGDGRFHSCVVSGLHHPNWITLSPKRDLMAVAVWKSVKIFHKV